MRTGYFSTLSARDLLAIRERREFEREETERQRLDEDREQYQCQYLGTLGKDEERLPPAFRTTPISFDAWREFADASISDPVLRGAQATNRALLNLAGREEQKDRDKAAEDVRANRPDPDWNLPPSAASLTMTVKEATNFAKQEAEEFVKATPSYYPCKQNWDRICSYIEAQGIAIPNRDVLAQAFTRLTELELLEQQPTPEPSLPEKPPQTETVNEPELVDGFDPETGAPRKFTQAEVWKMDSATYKKAFRAWGDNRPRFTRGYFD